MKKRILCGFARVLVMCALGFGGRVLAAEELVGPIYPVPRFGSFYSLAHTNWPPAPCPPNLFTNAVYAIVGFTNHYFYDDLSDPGHTGGLDRSEMMTSEEEGGDGPGPLDFGSYGTNLFIMIGLTNSGQAWLSLSNTHSGTYYQILSRVGVAQPPWEFGQILQASSSLTPFANVQVYDPQTRFFRGVGGDTVASIVPHPDYNLAVEPATSTNAAQVGKFLISINPTLGSSRTIVYQISGQATNGTDYTNLLNTVNIGGGQSSAEIVIGPKYNPLPGFDRSVTVSLVLSNGYLVSPTSGVATLKIYDPRPQAMAVAILDSGWTKFNRLSNTNWNYFVLPEAIKEALRADGTPYAVFSDLDIANGALMSGGLPKYPILIDLAGESIRDDEVAPLTNYVAAGGFVFAGSSAFTRGTNGGARPNFALAAQMGIGCNPAAVFWYDNTNFTKQSDHPLLRDIPGGTLVWRMPTSPEETSWGSCLSHAIYAGCSDHRGFDGPHQIWVVTNSSAQVLAVEDGAYPYIAIKQYGGGYFIYDAALQPLLGHGGFAPGMYAYMIFRRAIEWAFQAAQRPVVRLSPWQYTNDAAFMVRHDLEDYANEIAAVESSAYFEYTNGVKGDYYFCTGRITNEVTYASIVTGLQQAVGYGATIGPHNGGLPNPRASDDTNSCCYMNNSTYEYWHWGPDEALGLPSGKDYASNSLAISFAQIEDWLTNYQTNTPRVWVAPYFNATREESYEIQEALNVRITGDQKLTPFPAFTLSTRIDGKRYNLLSEPTSDWFVNGAMAQSMDPWHSPGIHTTNTVHDGVDFYYTNGFLLNFYAHGLSTGDDGPRPYPDTAGYLIPDYIRYCVNVQRFPRLWLSNAREIYAWWTKRYGAQVSASYSTNGSHSVVKIGIAGAQDTNTTIEVFAQGFGNTAVAQLLTNGFAAGTNIYRVNHELVKVRVGIAVTNVELEYYPGPAAHDDSYRVIAGQPFTVSAGGGVLSNDFSGSWLNLVAVSNSLPSHGTLQWNVNNDGGFTYTPAGTNFGTDCFTYEATDGVNSFGVGTVTLNIRRTNDVFSDDFTRCTTASITPWQVEGSYGFWGLNGDAIQGSQGGQYGYCHVDANSTNCSVEAKIYVAGGSFAGGLGGRVNLLTGAHYGAWIYPENSATALGAKTLALVKFSDWTTWGYNGVNQAPIAKVPLTGTVSNVWHTVKLTFSGSQINVYYDDNSAPKISTNDTDTASAVLPSGSVSLDLYDGAILVDDVSVTSP